ncbi:DUF349 domain-containing protein [Pseudoalteromonas pernae]|uniref:DUF349 domain-containing protein n=1 Tax=Pseudoalteromonas pernae TaxID=3118054 RepID=UPI003241D0CE
MIFKQFFQPKWKHPKETTRLGALSALDSQQHEQIIRELACSDPSSSVRAAALKKLNDVHLWWQACQQDAEPSIKRLANQKVGQALLESNEVLSDSDKELYIDRFAPDKLLEQLALQEKTNTVKIKLLKRLHKPQLVEQAFRSADEVLQHQLCDLVINLELAAKLQKFAQGEAQSQLNEYLERQQRAQEMPVEVDQQAKLLLAKLNALREKSDYQLVSTHFSALNQQFEQLDLSWLDDIQREQYEQKHSTLLLKLNSHLDRLKAEYDLELSKQQAQQRSVLALANLSALAEEIAHAMSLRFDGNEQIQTDWLHAKVDQARDMLLNEDLQPGQELNSQRAELERLFKQVEQLAAYEQDVATVRAVLGEYQALSVPTTTDELDGALAQESQLRVRVREAINALPKELTGHWQQQFKAAQKHWQAQVKPLTEEQNKLLDIAKKKAKDLRRLTSQGRYRVAFGVFNGLREVYEQMTQHFQQQVAREYEAIESMLDEAKDWHQYAGEAQQEQLVNAAKELASEQCEDANERLEQVKRLRKSWQLLGPEVDANAKELFEQAIELAFEPCRVHFAHQQEQKEQAIAQREQIIADMQTLSEQREQMQIIELERAFNLIVKQWREAKRLESKLYNKFNKRFNQAQGDVVNTIERYYDDNAAAKEALLQQAQQIQLDNVFAATNELKNLQQQWQKIGFAGKGKERKLWQAFRRINDDVFKQRDETKAVQQEELDALKTEQSEQLTLLSQSFEQSETLAQLQKLDAEITALNVIKELSADKEALRVQVRNTIEKLTKAAQNEHLISLKKSLQEQTAVDHLWLSNTQLGLSAEQLVVRIEISESVDSPASDAQLRMQEQVTMLDEKHHGVIHSTDALLKAWLAQSTDAEGNVSDEYATQCQRIIAVLDKMVSL